MQVRVCVFLWGLLSSAIALAGSETPDTLRTYAVPGITVTALRSMPIPAAGPYAFTLVSPEQWRYERSYGVAEALRWIPGLVVQDRSGGSDLRIVVRGFGARGAGDRSNNGTTRGVRILLDGVPLTEPDGRTALDLLEPAALTGAAVLRSNGTLLWGNASGGVLAFQTLPLQEREPAHLALGAGGFGFRKFALELAPAVSFGTLAFRAAYTTSQGWRRHSSARRWWTGLSLSSPLGSVTRLELSTSVTSNAFNIPGPLDWETFQQTPEAANSVYEQQRARRENLIAFLTASLISEVEPSRRFQLTLFAQPKFLVRSERGTYREFSRLHTGGSLLLQNRWQLGSSTLELVTGIDAALQDGPALFYRLTPEGGRDSVLVQNKREAALNAGAFLRTLLSLADQWYLWLGLRGEWLHYRLIDALRPSLSDQRLFRAALPSLGLSYRISEAHSLFAHLSSGWEVPAYNEIDPPPSQSGKGINPSLEPMLSWTAELGSQHRFLFSRRAFLQQLWAELALYRIESRNELVPYAGGRFYQNAARSERTGVEFQLQLQTWQGLHLRALASLARMRYRSYIVDSTLLGGSGQADFRHHRIPGVPEVQLGLQLAYRLPRLPIVLETELSYIGATYADDANTVRVPDYALWNAGIRLAQPLTLVGIAFTPWLEARNLANRRYVGSVYINPDRDAQGRALFAEPGMPRALTFGIHLQMGQPH
jgi:iron complex outermembrane receptor protein